MPIMGKDMPMMGKDEAGEPSGGGDESMPSGGVKDVVVGVQKGLLSLQGILGKSNVVDDQDKAQLDEIISSFESFIENLSQAPGQAKPSAMPETSTPEAGAAKTAPAM